MEWLASPAMRLARRVAFVAAALTGCSPTYDWRDVHPQGRALTLQFPCAPDRYQRSVALGERSATMSMLTCSAGDTTFALSVVEAERPEEVPAQLERLRATAVANLRGESPRLVAWPVTGSLPTAASSRLATRGHLPDGRAVMEHAVFFAAGTVLYQASVVGSKPVDEMVDTFFASIRLGP